MYLPFNLNFEASTRNFKRRLDAKLLQLSRKAKGVYVSPKAALNKPNSYPIYPIFKSPAMAKILSHELRQFSAS